MSRCWYNTSWTLELIAGENRCIGEIYVKGICYLTRNQNIERVYKKVDCYENVCLMDYDNHSNNICKYVSAKCDVTINKSFIYHFDNNVGMNMDNREEGMYKIYIDIIGEKHGHLTWN